MSENKENKSFMLEKSRAELLKNDIIKLCSCMSVTGFEYRVADFLAREYGSLFDSVECDGVGNYIFIKRCRKENAPKIMVDTHFDEIGFVVCEILEGGFLRFTNVGGTDRAIMQGADVIIYGKEQIRGVISSVPPHLREGDGKLPTIDKMLIDVGLGYTKTELEELVCVGTPVGFAPVYSELLNNKIVGKSFDNKACAAMAIRALSELDASDLAGDIYLTLSCREESAKRGGAYVCANRIKPDYALVIDVNLANAPDVSSRESVKMDGGISISVCSATDRALTRRSAELCEKKGLDYIIKAEASSTGTNAVCVNLASFGIPVVDVGLPLRNMHTYNEVISLVDCQTLCNFIKAFVGDADIAKDFIEEELCI